MSFMWRFFKKKMKKVLLLKRDTKKIRSQKKTNITKEVDEKSRPQHNKELLFKKYLDLLRKYNSELPYRDQINVLKVVTAKDLNKAKGKIHKRNTYTFRSWYDLMRYGKR